MGQVIVVTSGKAQAGKTLLTANLGTALAQLGKKVCLLDADIGQRNLDVVMGMENRIVYDLIDVVEGNARLERALVKDKRIDNLYLLAAAQTREKKYISAVRMQALTEQLARDFDFVLLDCPAGIEDGFHSAIAGAQQAIVVCTSDVLSVRNADRLIALWDARRESKSPAKLVVNRMHPNMVAQGGQLHIDDMLEMLAVDLLGIVPEEEYVGVSFNRGEPAVYHQQSIAGMACRNIARRLLGEQVPIVQFDLPPRLWKRCLRWLGLRPAFGSTPLWLDPGVCWKCGTCIPRWAKFCFHCGENLQGKTCGQCHTRMPPQFGFCGKCGVAVSESASANQPLREKA